MRQAMVRKQIYIEVRQDKLLKRMARERGTTEAEVVREALDRYTAGPNSAAADEIWRREVEHMRQISQRLGPHRPRDWRREDLYEDRQRRYDRHPG